MINIFTDCCKVTRSIIGNYKLGDLVIIEFKNGVELVKHFISEKKFMKFCVAYKIEPF